VGAELLHSAEQETARQAGRQEEKQASRQVHITKLIEAFCNFVKTPKNATQFTAT